MRTGHYSILVVTPQKATKLILKSVAGQRFQTDRGLVRSTNHKSSPNYPLIKIFDHKSISQYFAAEKHDVMQWHG